MHHTHRGLSGAGSGTAQGQPEGRRKDRRRRNGGRNFGGGTGNAERWREAERETERETERERDLGKFPSSLAEITEVGVTVLGLQKKDAGPGQAPCLARSVSQHPRGVLRSGLEFGFPLCLIPVACSGAKGWRPSSLTHATEGRRDRGRGRGVPATPPGPEEPSWKGPERQSLTWPRFMDRDAGRRAATWDQHGGGAGLTADAAKLGKVAELKR
uniref:Uncharacterized protein n=1 Tax=Myotis myotis TaxID=51298 RepID=A0A7J7T6V2_MYOMY|nr:hypothetical protein mMyoMyo1_009228 [Myotis myotis]